MNEENLISIINKKDKIINTLLKQNKELKRKCKRYAELQIGEKTCNRYNEILRKENKRLKSMLDKVKKND